MKPLGKVRLEWSSEFAYAIGLIVTDGSLSKDGRHITLVSKDLEMIDNFRKSLGVVNKTGSHTSGHAKKKNFRIQLGDRIFYDFLVEIGLMPNKTKIVKEVDIPQEYFADFLRGHFDGDGCFYSYWDKRWKSSFMYYITFLSASESHVDWLREMLRKKLDVKGHISTAKKSSVCQLRYAKKESDKIIKYMYYSDDVVCLSRKHLKIRKVLDSMG
jgi:intein-encoded DNA endonuclease-like protein